MKKILSITLISLALFQCGSDDNISTKPIIDNFDTSKATLIKSGEFITVSEPVSGTASLYDSSGSFYIVLNPFMSANGPDVKVYLSTDADASQYIKLGNLKSTTGKQTYEVPAGTDLTKFTYVHIWCERFTVNFGNAQLK